jgi:hypothetical protein
MKDTYPDNFYKKSNDIHYCIAKGDTGASSHYFMTKNKNILQNIKQINGPPVLLPNQQIITSSEQGVLPISHLLSEKAQKTMILPDLKSSNLISIGQLCDDGCDITLDKNEMIITKNNQFIMRGQRNPRDGLWDIPIPKSKITNKCCLLPSIHPNIYPITAKATPTKITPTPTKPKLHNIPIHLKNLGNLADYNDFTDAIDKHTSLNNTITNHKANIIIRKKQTHKDLVTYLHACCFSPVKSTFQQAIKKGFFKTWPGLTTQLVEKHLTTSTATVKGHLVQERANLQSTKVPIPANIHPIDSLCEKTSALSLEPTTTSNPHSATNITDTNSATEDFYPIPDVPNKRSNKVIYAVIDRSDMSVGYIDACGRFPQRSSSGNEYIIVAYHYDGNAILATATKDRTAQSLTNAWESIHKQLESSGNSPDIYVLDNEKSSEIIEAFNKYNVKYQLAPPYSHRTNLAERAIQTFKSHFKAGLASCDPNFPLSEWDRLLPQAVLTLNMLRASRTNPRISAYTHIFGEYDFRSTPLAPPGTKIIAHVKPDKRNTWDLHGTDGYYIGPALLHYRCVTCYFPRTKAERICDTVSFISKTIPIPKTNTHEYLHQAASDIIHILTSPPSPTVPSLAAGDPVRQALYDLATLIQKSGPIGPPPLPHTSSKGSSIHSDDTAPPRVPLTVRATSAHPTTLPRVAAEHPVTTRPVAVTALDPINVSPKNSRFNNTRNHRYPLRSRTKLNLLSESSHNPFLQMLHIFDEAGRKLSIDNLLKSEDGPIWDRGLSNEWGRLANGNKRGIKGTNTIQFIHKHDVPHDRNVTYATFVCTHKPLKSETHRVRITVGGDRLSCLEDTGSPTANMLETKCLVNSTISHAKYNARFMSADITNYFLATPMNRSEYMKVPLRYFPSDIIVQYNLQELVHNGYIYIKIVKRMYRLKNAAILAYNNLKKKLLPFGYKPVKETVGL